MCKRVLLYAEQRKGKKKRSSDASWKQRKRLFVSHVRALAAGGVTSLEEVLRVTPADADETC